MEKNTEIINDLTDLMVKLEKVSRSLDGHWLRMECKSTGIDYIEM